MIEIDPKIFKPAEVRFIDLKNNSYFTQHGELFVKCEEQEIINHPCGNLFVNAFCINTGAFVQFDGREKVTPKNVKITEV